MKKNITYIVLTLCLCFTTQTSSALVRLVSSLNDSGTGTLRAQIAAASPGDTILMDVKGTIFLQSPITINKKLNIFGAFAVHSVINGASSSGTGEGFIIQNISGNDTLVLHGFKFEAFDGFNSILLVDNSNVRVLNCVFKNNVGSASGMVVNTALGTHMEFFACSFFALNSGSQPGGAFRINPGDICKVANCTFSSCASSSSGGAISNFGNLFVVHCTFINNTAPQGRDISNGSGGTVTLYNNIFSNSVPSQQFFDVSGTSWTNLGGNVFTATAGAYAPAVMANALDNYTGTGNQTAVGLKPTSVTDGYGIEYFPITNGASPAVDFGITTALLPENDQRRAPRILRGAGTMLIPDAGAVEYTPYRVIASSGPGSFQNVWTDMNTFGGGGGPEYMEFDLGAPTVFTLAGVAAYSNNVIRIIDGYTQHGTAVAGPRNPSMAGTFITPANIAVTIINTSGGVLDLDMLTAGSSVSGLIINNGQNYGILANDCDIEIFGNVINAAISTAAGGIKIQGGNSTTNAYIGGEHYYRCNVIGGYSAVGSSGITVETKNIGRISGNLIGTTNTGLAGNQNSEGIHFLNCANWIVGGHLYLPSRNVISSNAFAQVYDEAGNNKYLGNYIGTDISGAVALGGMSICGIHFTSGTRGEIGAAMVGRGNIIVNQSTGILADNSSGNGGWILNNFIGVGIYPTLPIIPNGTGISLINNLSTGGYSIGNGTFDGKNYICGSTNMGIYIDASDDNTINGNNIGLLGTNIHGNGAIGIHLVNGSSVNTISRNIIAGHANLGTGAGIHLNAAGVNNMINLNKIGTDSIGNNPKANETGIFVDNQNAFNLVITDNVISGNSVEGIQINNSPTQIIITNNIIGLNALQNAAIPNTNGIVAYSSNNVSPVSNIIAGNTMRGIYMADCSGAVIRGNKIGTNAALAPGLGNGAEGVHLAFSGTNGFVGGTNATDGNVIAYNGGVGVLLDHAVNNTAVLSNSIYDNGGLGISLDAINSFLPNDAGDADVSGVAAGNVGNNGQNYPVNLVAQVCTGGTVISGALFTTPGLYRIEFFAQPPGSFDPSGHGEGKLFLGSESVTSSIGVEPFTHVYTGILPAGTIITTTCSRDNGGFFETSEFSDTAHVTIPVLAVAGPDTSTCVGSSISLSGSASIGSGLTYSWNDLTSGGSAGNTAVIAVSPSITTMYQLVVSDGACTSFDTVIVTIVPPPSAAFSTSAASPYCVNSANITLTPSLGGGTFSGTGVTGSIFSPSVAGVGSHVILYSITQGNCSNADSMTVQVNPTPPLPTLLTSPPLEFCVGTSQSILVSNSGGITGWYSNVALTNQICLCNPLPVSMLSSGNYSLYVAEFAGGCLSQPLTISGVTVWGNTFVNNNGPYSSCENVGVPVTISVPVNDSVVWQPNTAISDVNSATPVITPSSTNNTFYYTAWLGITITCPVQDSIIMTINSCSIDNIVNAFSPNGDNTNDIWIIDPAYINPNNQVIVYNRWGNVLRRFEGYNNNDVAWDGTYKGNKVPPGTYYFTVELRDTGETKSGWVQVTY